MLTRSWKQHLLNILLGTTALLLVAWLSDRWLGTLIVGLTGYLLWCLFNMLRLYHWLRNEAQDPPASLGIWADIFDNIHRLQRLNREQDAQNLAIIREFESMTDAFPDATLVIDNNSAINWFNDSARRLLGLRTPEDVGQPVTNLLRDPDFADWLEVQEQVESEFEMFSPGDGSARLSVSAVRHRDDHRLLILRDVTELHNLERVRRDFVANVSHELRTPLTVLFGYLESIQDHCPEDMAPAIDRMQEQARQMQALLSDLLELSRLQNAEDDNDAQAIDVCALLAQLKEQADEISQGTHTIEVNCDSKAGLSGSAKDIESAFRNLINNAIHYTPEGGTVRISWEQSPEGSVFSVSDTGIGIPRKDIPRLTERFYRVGSDRSRHTGGTGLGLAIVKHVLNAHDARLAISSELGEGSTFSCIFPQPGR